MQSEAALTLILSSLRVRRAGTQMSRIPARGPGLGATEGSLSLRKRERVRVGVRLDCVDTAGRVASGLLGFDSDLRRSADQVILPHEVVFEIIGDGGLELPPVGFKLGGI